MTYGSHCEFLHERQHRAEDDGNEEGDCDPEHLRRQEHALERLGLAAAE